MVYKVETTICPTKTAKLGRNYYITNRKGEKSDLVYWFNIFQGSH